MSGPDAPYRSYRSDWDGPEPVPTMDLGDVVRAVTSRLRLAPICLAAALAVAGAYIVLSPKAYTATMSILIDPRERVPAGVDAAPMPQNPDPALVESQTRLLTSRPVLRKAVEAERLQDERGSFLGELLATIRALFEPSDGPSGPDARIEKAVDRLEKDVSTKRGERTYVIDVDVKGRTREKAVRTAQALADAFIAAQARMADDVAKKSDAFLDAKIADLRARVEDAERKAQAYRQSHGLVLTEGRTSPEQRLKDANSALVAAQGKRAEVEARVRQSRGFASRDLAADGADALQSPVIEKLRAEYSALARDQAYARSVLGPRHPTFLTVEQQLASVRAQIRAEEQRILQANERELRAARAAEETAARLVASLEAKTNEVGDERLGLTELDRAAATLRANYEKTLSARENVRKDAVPSPTAVVIDPPTAPASPSSPKTIPALLIALGAGFNLWIVAALVAEYRARRADGAAPVRSFAPDAPDARGVARASPARTANRRRTAPRRDERSAPGALSTPDLWRARPRAAGENWRSGPTRLAAVGAAMRRRNGYSRAVEAIHAQLRDRLNGAEGPPPALCVLSDQRGDGATTLALSLAHAACNAGERVLLVDDDRDEGALTAFASGFKPAPVPGLRQPARRLRRDEASGGEILCLSVGREGDLDEALDAFSDVDLAIVDGGARGRGDRALTRLAGADAVLIATQAGATPRDLGALRASASASGVFLAKVETGVEGDAR